MMKRPSFLRSPATDTVAEYVHAKVPGGSTPWRLANYCVVDLELSGLDPHHDEIISFAAVPIEGGRVIAGGAIYGECRPTRPLLERSVLINGIRTVDLADAAPHDEAIQALLAVMAGRVLVVHVAWVERLFLGKALERLGGRLREPVLDTHELGRLLALQRETTPVDFSLEALARSLNLPVHRQHHALGDAVTTAQVFIALATHLEEFSSETVRSLSQAKERARWYAH